MNVKKHINMQARNTYEQIFPIYSYMVDVNQYLTLPNLMSFMQEVAWAHSNNNDVGWHFLQSKNMFWALVRLYIEIERMPCWNESLRLKTWGRPMELISYPREFVGFDANNNCILKATSSWVILDKDDFKPQKIDIERTPAILHDEIVLQKRISKIPHLELYEPKNYHSVLFSDIDMNKHVNNTRYLNWILDEYGFEFLQTHRIVSCNIHFMSQAQADTSYAIQREEKENLRFISSIFRSTPKQELCRVQIKWKDISSLLHCTK